MNCTIVKKPHYTRVRRALAWKDEQASRIAKDHARKVRQGFKAQRAAEHGILPEQAQAFNPIRGLAKVV